MEAATNNKTLDEREQSPEVAAMPKPFFPPPVDMAEGVEVVKQAFEFIGELIELNSRIVKNLPPPIDEERMKKKLLAEMRAEEQAYRRMQGYNIAEAAELLGVDRGTLRGHLVVIPSGPAPHLPAGKIPCRQIGKARRIFEQDLFGTFEDKVAGYDSFEKTTASSNQKRNWRRQMDDLRFEEH